MERKLILFLTLMLSGRAMTLAFIPQVGRATEGAPPPAWLMPLIGDAIIGVTALLIVYLILKKTGLWVWTAIIVWNAVAIWDALSAFVIHTTNPWPEFFMIKFLGPSMFFGAILMHLVIIVLVSRSDLRMRLLG